MTRVHVRRGLKIAAIVACLVAGPLARAASAVGVPGNYPTIQSAINAVVSGALPDGTVIDVQPGTYSERLVISNTAKSLTVRAAGAPGSVVVDALGLGDAALTIVQATGNVVIKGLSFRRANRFVGGGFVIQNASPTLSNCVFELNTASYGAGGAIITANPVFNACTIRNNVATGTAGGVIIQAGARPVFTGCNIVNNTAGTATADGVGGGIQSLDASPTFRGSHINNNSSKFAGGGIYHAGTFGSAYGTATLVLEDSEIADNVSAPFSAAYNPAEGGGVHVEDNAVATLTRVRVLRNKANSGGGLNAYRARYDLVDSLVDSNQANARTDGGPDAGIGGGILASSTNVTAPPRPASVVNLTRSLVRNNVSLIGGGVVVTGDVGLPATLTLTGSVVDGNSTTTQGGGILASRTNLTANNSMIIRNSVAGGAAPFGGGVLVITSSSAAMTGTTIAHNSATLGGGIFMNDTAAINLNSSNVYDNSVTGTNSRGSGIFVGSGSTGTVQNSTIADNTDTLYHSEIHEEACSAVTYQTNTITPAPMFSGCAVGGRASGNNSNVPRFAHFLAVPAAGTSATLVWSVARATSVTIGGFAPSNQATGSIDVSPTASTTYSLSAATASGPIGPVTAGVTVVVPPSGASHGVPGDFDGDGRAEIAVYRPSNGVWYVRGLATTTWGVSTDIPVVGDFDGDGKEDYAVFRPSAGVWYIRNSSNGTWTGTNWGVNGDVPAPGDYDGDGKTDVAIFRPLTGAWYIINSSNSSITSMTWGGGGDVPVPGDYDGDGKTDIAVFRPSTGTWYIVNSSTGSGAAFTWGGGGDIPVAADYDGDGKTDIAVFRPSTGVWYVVKSSGGSAVTGWGGGGDVPVPGDYDGDGRTDVAIFRPSTGAWWIIQSGTGTGTSVGWGGGGDKAVLGRP